MSLVAYITLSGDKVKPLAKFSRSEVLSARPAVAPVQRQLVDPRCRRRPSDGLRPAVLAKNGLRILPLPLPFLLLLRSQAEGLSLTQYRGAKVNCCRRCNVANRI